jgi:DNA mismatch repair ATPase MutS
LRPVAALLVLVQGVIALATSRATHSIFALVDARRGQIEAYAEALSLIDSARFESPRMVALRERARLGSAPPSESLGKLDRLAGFAALREQFLLHFPINVAVLWDLHIAAGLARWRSRYGASLPAALDALAEIEALASLATLAHQDPDAIFPEITPPGEPFEAEGIAHPLIPPAERVANDVSLPHEGSLLLVTGSNMAGKSTLLRSVGLSLALAFAGGPVIARRFRSPPVRLRASMRIDDSLARGASYFHAELEKLRAVVAELEEGPPVFFLLDELLRGTNAKARHEGARAVIRHLLARRAMGLAATHDIALSELEQEQPGIVRNVHFTDVVVAGEMRFDYQLRPGVVRTSNALRLLRAAGIDVDES